MKKKKSENLRDTTRDGRTLDEWTGFHFLVSVYRSLNGARDLELIKGVEKKKKKKRASSLGKRWRG